MDPAEATTTAARAHREQELLRRIHVDSDRRARDELAEEMLPLARALAGRYANRGEPLDDLVQVACIGIMKAIDGFDIAREVRFSSYATPTVLGEIKRHFRDKTWAMRVPARPAGAPAAGGQGARQADQRARPLADRAGDRRRGRRAVRGGPGDDPERQRAAHALARRAHRRGRHAGRLAGLLDPELERAEIRALLDGAFDVLSERDQEVLRLRFAEDLTQTEIAKRIGVSQMQVSRLIRQSLARLRMDIERSPERRAPRVGPTPPRPPPTPVPRRRRRTGSSGSSGPAATTSAQP